RVGRGADALEERLLELRVVEEAAAGARVTDAEAFIDDTEAAPGEACVTADDDDRARAHVLLLAEHVRDAFVAVVRERFRRMLEQAGFLAGLRGRDGGRQVDEPFRVDGEAADHLERGYRVFLADGDATREPGRDQALAEHVL